MGRAEFGSDPGGKPLCDRRSVGKCCDYAECNRSSGDRLRCRRSCDLRRAGLRKGPRAGRNTFSASNAAAFLSRWTFAAVQLSRAPAKAPRSVRRIAAAIRTPASSTSWPGMRPSARRFGIHARAPSLGRKLIQPFATVRVFPPCLGFQTGGEAWRGCSGFRTTLERGSNRICRMVSRASPMWTTGG